MIARDFLEFFIEQRLEGLGCCSMSQGAGIDLPCLLWSERWRVAAGNGIQSKLSVRAVEGPSGSQRAGSQG